MENPIHSLKMARNSTESNNELRAKDQREFLYPCPLVCNSRDYGKLSGCKCPENDHALQFNAGIFLK